MWSTIPLFMRILRQNIMNMPCPQCSNPMAAVETRQAPDDNRHYNDRRVIEHTDHQRQSYGYRDEGRRMGNQLPLYRRSSPSPIRFERQCSIGPLHRRAHRAVSTHYIDGPRSRSRGYSQTQRLSNTHGHGGRRNRSPDHWRYQSEVFPRRHELTCRTRSPRGQIVLDSRWADRPLESSARRRNYNRRSSLSSSHIKAISPAQPGKSSQRGEGDDGRESTRIVNSGTMVRAVIGRSRSVPDLHNIGLYKPMLLPLPQSIAHAVTRLATTEEMTVKIPNQWFFGLSVLSGANSLIWKDFRQQVKCQRLSWKLKISHTSLAPFLWTQSTTSSINAMT